MEVRINIEKRHFFILIGVILLLIGVIAVVAYNPSGTGGVPSEMGHSVDEIEWSQVIPGLSVGEVGSATTIDSGGIIMGNMLNMNSKTLTNLPAPVNPNDAVRFEYADNHYLKRSGGTMSGILNMGNNRITNLRIPGQSGDAVSLEYFNRRVRGVKEVVDGCGLTSCQYDISLSGFTNTPIVTCTAGPHSNTNWLPLICMIRASTTQTQVKITLASGNANQIIDTEEKEIYLTIITV